MYNEKIESLISIALVDGELSEKERQILFQKAQEEGIDLEEFKKVLEQRLFEAQKNQRINIKGKKSPSDKPKSSEDEHDWKYYQKKYAEEMQIHYEKQEKRRKYYDDFEWKNIIPTTAQEAIGAMAFACMYLGDMHEGRGAQSTLKRVIELCKNDFREDGKVQKVLPQYKNALKQQEEKEASKEHRRGENYQRYVKNKRILWIVVLVLLVLQIIFWGWWTILTGIITVVIAGIIHLFLFNYR